MGIWRVYHRTRFDLPIALGIVAATDLIPRDSCQDYLVLGELALDGFVRPIKGVLPMSITARDTGLKGIFLPPENAPEAAVVKGIDIFPVRTLYELVEALSGIRRIDPFRVEPESLFQHPDEGVDFADVRGQENVKRAMEIAAAGGHNMLMM